MATNSTDSRSAIAARVMDGAALFLVLVVIGLRPLVQEVPTTALDSFSRALGTTGGQDPTFSLLMTLMILAAALLVWVGRLVHPRRWRLLGIEWGGALLLVVAVASCFFASDRRIAINETANWLALPLLAMVAAQLFDRPRAASLAIAVIVASAATFAFQCVRQARHEFDDTIQSYNEMREKFWADQGVPLDDPQVTMFERRLLSREASGYASHSNVAGSYLVGAAFVAAAAAISRFGGTMGLIWFALATMNAVLAVGLFATVWLTGSRGAMVAGIVGIVLLAVGWTLRRRIAVNPRRWFIGGWVVALMIAGGVISVGAVRGGLPTPSMQFRWGYWRNAMMLVAEHPWVGVGAGNFANHYSRVKPVTDPEEVADAHHFLVSATAQWGIPGGLAMLAMIVGASAVCVLRRRGDDHWRAPPADGDWLRSAGWVALWTAGLAVVIFAIRHAHLGSADAANYAYAFDTPRRIWIVTFLVAYVSRHTLGLCNGGFIRAGGRAIVAAGVVAMLLHATIEMTLSQYGSAVTLMAMLALVDTRPTIESGREDRARSWVGAGATAIAALAVVWFAVVPTTKVMFHLTEARLGAQASAPASQVRAAYEAAVVADPYDPNPPGELAAWLMARAGQATARPTDAVEFAGLAVDRNPASAGAWRGLAGAHLYVFARTGDATALRGAAEAVRHAVSCYPESPTAHLMLADVMERVAGVSAGAARESALRDAAGAYRRALDLDAQRDAEEIRRFTDARRAAIQRRLHAIRGMVRPIGDPRS